MFCVPLPCAGVPVIFGIAFGIIFCVGRVFCCIVMGLCAPVGVEGVRFCEACDGGF